jgi:D-glycero-D-manno-heptose 1,7-bisphosphate phosphatase
MNSANRALFLDRDGVINVDAGYTFEREKFVFVDGIFDLALAAMRLHYRIIVITNQAGIGRGYYTEADFKVLTDWMRAEFSKRGAPITDVFYCPDHPEFGLGKYKKESADRKPNPGMILRAIEKHDLLASQSLMIGDKDSDMRAAFSAGIGIRCLFRSSADVQEESIFATHEKTSLVNCIPLLE